MESKNPAYPLLPQQITTRKLNGSNYRQWSKAVKVYLTGQGKQSHLTDDAPNTNDKVKAAWMQEDAQLVSQLWNSMEPEMADMCTHLDTCKEIWEYVCLLYSSNLTSMYDLSQEYFRLQQEGRTVTEYFAKLKQVYEELNVVFPLSSDIKVMQKQREQMVVLKFLAGLKPEFDSVKSQILGGAELPSFAETYSQVLRASTRDNSQSTSISMVDNLSTLVTPSSHSGKVDLSYGGRGHRGGCGRGIRGGRGGRGPPRHCTHCGLDNHTRETCWDLVGRPTRFANVVTSDNVESLSSASVNQRVIADQKQVVVSEEEYMKKILEEITGLEPEQQKILFRGQEKEESEYLHVAGVKDNSKALVLDDVVRKGEKLEQMKEGEETSKGGLEENEETSNVANNRSEGQFEVENKESEEMSKAFQAIAVVRAEVDKLAERVAALEVAVNAGTQVLENEFVVSSELLMRQLLKLDTIEAEGEARMERKAEVCRVQSFQEILDNLKARNSKTI